MVTLIQPDFAQSPILTDAVVIMCIHGETEDHPTTLLHLQTPKGQHKTSGSRSEPACRYVQRRGKPMEPKGRRKPEKRKGDQKE